MIHPRYSICELAKDNNNYDIYGTWCITKIDGYPRSSGRLREGAHDESSTFMSEGFNNDEISDINQIFPSGAISKNQSPPYITRLKRRLRVKLPANIFMEGNARGLN